MSSKHEIQPSAEQALTNAIASITNEQLEMNQFLGRVEAMQALAYSIEAFSLSQLAEIKDKKLYRHFNNQTVIRDGMEVPLNTWAGFCRAINSSDKTIDEKLVNLRLLGEEALQKSEALGITTKQLRQLRKLDEADQTVIIGEIEANAGDKESIIELIEDMSVKHAKQKQTLESKISSLEKEAKAKDAVIRQKQDTIDAKNDEIIQMDKKLAMKLDAPTHERAKALALEIDKLKIDALTLLGQYTALFEQIANDSEAMALIRINMGHAMLELKDGVDNLIIHHGLDDVSVADDDFGWADDAAQAIAERDATKPTDPNSEQGLDSEEFGLVGQTPEEIAAMNQ